MQAKGKCLKSHTMELSKCFKEFTITIVFLSMYDISDNDNDNVYSAHIVVYISGHEISIFSISEVFITFNTSRKNVTCFYVQ